MQQLECCSDASPQLMLRDTGGGCDAPHTVPFDEVPLQQPPLLRLQQLQGTLNQRSSGTKSPELDDGSWMELMGINRSACWLQQASCQR